MYFIAYFASSLPNIIIFLFVIKAKKKTIASCQFYVHLFNKNNIKSEIKHAENRTEVD